MNKEFLPYAEALALKELGFDEPCFGSYAQHPKSDEGLLELGNTYNLKAPLYQQAFRWFREIHGLYGFVDRVGITYIYKIRSWKNEAMESSEIYEVAQLECLRKLIEILKKWKSNE
jgi:hypothetical protein